jgi:hypothetical protein
MLPSVIPTCRVVFPSLGLPRYIKQLNSRGGEGGGSVTNVAHCDTYLPQKREVAYNNIYLNSINDHHFCLQNLVRTSSLTFFLLCSHPLSSWPRTHSKIISTILHYPVISPPSPPQYLGWGQFQPSFLNTSLPVFFLYCLAYALTIISTNCCNEYNS